MLIKLPATGAGRWGGFRWCHAVQWSPYPDIQWTSTSSSCIPSFVALTRNNLNHFDLKAIGIRVNCRPEFYCFKKCITMYKSRWQEWEEKTSLIKRVQQIKWELNVGIRTPAKGLDPKAHLLDQSTSTNEIWQDFKMIKQNNILNK